MPNIRYFIYVIVLLSLPFQFSFHMNFYSTASSKIEKNWDFSKITKLQIDISNKITTYTAAISAILTIFISYKIHNRRIPICICFLLSGIVFLVYLSVDDSIYWLVILLKAINGIFLGFFQSVHISYIMNFADRESLAFHGCLVQFTMFLSLIILNLLIFACSWKVVTIILAVQSFLFAGLIWFVPEIRIQSKSSANPQIYQSPNLRNLLLMIGVMVIQCFSGISFMIDNCSRLMEGIGISIDSTLHSVLTNFIGCLSTLIAAFIMDIVSVRYMWTFSGIGLVISLIIYDLTLKFNCPNWLGVFAVFFYFLFFGLGEGPVPWLICGVFFPQSVMIESGAINCFMNRFMDIWFGYLQNEITKAFGEFGSVIFSAAFSFLGAILGLFLIPTFKSVHHENTTIL